METISLKALSLKVLHGNTHGNKMETLTFLDGNIGVKKEGKSFHSFHDGTMTETDIKKMSLSEFGKAELTLKIWSEVLQDHILFISNEEVVNDHPLGLVSYSAAELTEMLSMTPEEVRTAHTVKSIFNKAKVTQHKGVAA